MFPQISDVRREKFEQNLGGAWSEMQNHVDPLMEQLLIPTRTVDIETLESCDLTVDKHAPLVTFRGMGLVAKAIPKVIKKEGHWLVEMTFHRINTSIVGEETSEPIYIVTVDREGDVRFGAGSNAYPVFPHHKHQEGLIRRRLMIDLLCIAEDSQP